MSDNKFNFDAFNQLKKTAPAGLKIFLAQQLMDEVLFTATRYKNPLRFELDEICVILSKFRENWKKASARRAQNDSSVATAHIDDLEAMKVHTTSADGGKVDTIIDTLSKKYAILLEKVTEMEKARDADIEDAKQILADVSENIALRTGNSVEDTTPTDGHVVNLSALY